MAYFLLLSGLTVAVVAIVTFDRATDDLRRSAFERLEAVADLKEDALDRWVDEQRRNVILVANIPGLGDAAATFLDSASDREAAGAARDTIARTLETAARQTTDAQAFALLDPEGIIRVSSRSVFEGTSRANEYYFERGSSDTTVQNVYTSELTRQPTVTVSTPLVDATGRERVAILAADLALGQVNRIVLASTGLGGDGATYLVGPDGAFIHTSMRDEDPPRSTGIDLALAGESGSGVYDDHEGRPVIGVYRWLDDHDAALMVELSQSAAFAPARELLLLIGIIGLVSALLLGSGVWIISRRVSRPLGQLEAAATAVADGDLDVTAPVTSEDEVGRLTAAFNVMTAQLRENVETLERRVEERTAELSAALEGQKAAEEQYRRLVEELPMAVYSEEPDGSAEAYYISPRVEELFGYPPARWAQDGFLSSIIYPEDRERVLAGMSAAPTESGGRLSLTYRVIAADSGIVWVQDQRWTVRGEDGTPLYVQGFLTDVTERTLEQSELKRQKAYFESLVDASPVAVVTAVGEDDLVVSWNPGATRLFGWEPAEALGRTVDDLVAADESLREDSRAVTREASVTGRASRLTRRTRKDGSFVDVEVSVVPLMVDGQEIAVLAIYHDVTELVAARQEADSANQAKSTFLAAMSHEIRTPMNAIIGMSGLLGDTELSAEQREYVETIQTSGDALLTIINDILDFSKIEAGRVELESRPFSLSGCLEGALDVLARTAAAKGIELAYDIDTQLPGSVVGDEGRLRQIVLNLLSNAVKFTEHGEVELNAAGSAPDGPDAPWSVRITVRDTGIGIPPDRIGRLFQSFSQADASISRRFGGTGLGLAISRRLAELMGGSLTVESSGVEGEGSTFTLVVRLPAAEATSIEAAAPVSEAELAGRKVLIVDDNDTNRRILTAQVGRWGMEPYASASPTEALHIIEAGDPVDLVLTDLHMPEMDGLGLAAAVRRERPDVPIVVLSSVGHRGDGETGVAAYLTKPVKPSSLHDTIQTVLSGTETGPLTRAAGTATLDPEMAAQHPLRILLAEDNAVNQKLALKLLERMGYPADVVGDGAEAVAAVGAERYDVVLMDVQMPELDGLEATRRIIAAHPDERPRIVAMTANAMDEDREACFAAGMDDYISKPIRVEALVEALWRVSADGARH